MKKVIKGLVKGTFSPLGLASIGIESDLLHKPLADGTMNAQKARERQDLINKLPKETRKKLKSFKQFQEAAALAIPAAGLVGKFALPAAATIVGGVGTYLQSRKKKAEKEDLLGAVRKKQAEIQQDVANKETLKQNEKITKKDKERGEYLPRKRAPENEFAGEFTNNQGPGIKPGSGTIKGGVWDRLPKGQQSNWNKGNNIQGIAKEVKKQQSKAKLKKLLRDKYGNKDQLTGGTLPEEMMGAGAIVNNVGDGKIAGTVEAGDDPPKKKKKRYIYGGKGSRKMWMN